MITALSSAWSSPAYAKPTSIEIEGLRAEVRVVVDADGVTHVSAANDLDLARVQGFVHARDRFFQMDLMRRQGSGELAELFGSSRLADDVAARTLGLERAARRSVAALRADERELLQAYADGVNAFLRKGPLPREYALLELTRARPWTVVDTLTIFKVVLALLSLDLDVERTLQLNEYIQAGLAAGFDGQALYFQDVKRVAPIDPAATVPDAGGTPPFLGGLPQLAAKDVAAAATGAKQLQAKLEHVPFLSQVMRRQELGAGSNEWGVTAAQSRTGRPMIANDPHLFLDAPATFYEWQLQVANDPLTGPLNVTGVGFPGVPGVILGQNEHIAWGATTNPLDVSDIFADTLVVDPQGTCAPVQSQACILTEGAPWAVVLETAVYRTNVLGDGVLDNLVPAPLPPEQTLIATVPFRSFGPVLSVVDPSVLVTGGTTTATVLQYTGFHATREPAAFAAINRAQSVAEFISALDDFDFGSQNWAVADANGNLAYLASAESPLRRDLEAGQVVGLPPFFIRDGSGAANWVADPARRQGQAIPFAVLPFQELPRIFNPSSGFFANSNNDPVGVSLDNDVLNQRRRSKPSAIYYLSALYSDGLRAGRVTRLLRDRIASGRKVSFQDMQVFQANVQQLDAELLTPFLQTAFERAQASGAPPLLARLAADPEIAEAVGRIAAWDFSSPTGVPEGYDASDKNGRRKGKISRAEADASVAATLYNVWRAKLVRRVVDSTLSRVGVSPVTSSDALKATFNLLRSTPFTGVGASGIDFFPAPAQLASAADRRDATLLAAMREALDALASDDFAVAFGRSRNQADYRWGKLHRITFDHPFVPQLSIPPAAGFQDFAPSLPGLSRDGAYEVVNQSGFSATADRPQDFTFGFGPSRRYVGEVLGNGRPQSGTLDPGIEAASGNGSGKPKPPTGGPGVNAVNVIPGGPSGDPLSDRYATQLPDWLTADYHEVTMKSKGAALSDERFIPSAD